MTLIKSKTAKIAAGLVGFALAFAVVATPVAPASAQTSAELQAMINTLLAQIAALQGQVGGSTSASHTFTMDLTVGSTGSEVVALQDFLISKGFLSMPAGVAKGYFGELTRAAVAAYQTSKGIMPPAGYVGPATRASMNAGMVVVPPVVGGGGTTPPPSTGGLQGGAGSVENYDLVSGLNNEEVGEDEEDAEVAGLEIEADDSSDLEITAVRLVFNEGTAGSDFEDYAAEVSIWFEGEEVARVDGDSFNDDNDWTKTVSLDSGAIIEAGETGELTVAITGISNLDSGDAADTWTVDFRQVRFEDADGAVISEDPATDTRSFSFESFATAADLEFKITSGDDAINDAHTIAIDDTDDTDNVDILSYNVEIEGDSDVIVDSLPVGITVTGVSHVDDAISGLTLLMDGEEVGSANLSDSLEDADGADVGTYESFLFDDMDLTLEAGNEYEFTVQADFFATTGTGDLDEGDTLAASTTHTLLEVTGYSDIEDESGEDLTTSEITGSASSDASAVYVNSIDVDYVSGDHENFEVDGDDNDYTQLTLEFNVTAFGEDVYIPNVTTDVSSSTSATGGVPTTAQGVGYHIQSSSAFTMASTSVIETLILSPDSDGGEEETNSFLVEEGDTATFLLTITITNGAAPANLDGEQFRAILTGIGFGNTDSATADSVFTADLQDSFRTDYGRVAN